MIVIFSKAELCCFNSILENKNPIFGISIDAPQGINKGAYINNTVESLRQKGLVTSEGKLEKVAVLPIKMLEAYNKSRSYLFMNKVRVGFIDANWLVTLSELDTDRIDLIRISKAQFMIELLKNYPYLCGGRAASSDSVTVRKVNIQDWGNEFEKMIEPNTISTMKFKDKKIKSFELFYWSMEKNGVYDILTQEDKEMSSLKMRRKFADMLEIK